MNIARTPSGSPQAGNYSAQWQKDSSFDIKSICFAVATLKMPVLNITGSLSPHIDDTVTFNGRLEPTKTNWMKVCQGHFDFVCKFVTSIEENELRIFDSDSLLSLDVQLSNTVNMPASTKSFIFLDKRLRISSRGATWKIGRGF